MGTGDTTSDRKSSVSSKQCVMSRFESLNKNRRRARKPNYLFGAASEVMNENVAAAAVTIHESVRGRRGMGQCQQVSITGYVPLRMGTDIYMLYMPWITVLLSCSYWPFIQL